MLENLPAKLPSKILHYFLIFHVIQKTYLELHLQNNNTLHFKFRFLRCRFVCRYCWLPSWWRPSCPGRCQSCRPSLTALLISSLAPSCTGALVPSSTVTSITTHKVLTRTFLSLSIFYIRSIIQGEDTTFNRTRVATVTHTISVSLYS